MYPNRTTSEQWHASTGDAPTISYPFCHKYYIFFNNCDIGEIFLLHKIGGNGLKRLNDSRGKGDPDV